MRELCQSAVASVNEMWKKYCKNVSKRAENIAWYHGHHKKQKAVLTLCMTSVYFPGCTWVSERENCEIK